MGIFFPPRYTLTLCLRLTLTFTCHSVMLWVQESELQESAVDTLLQWAKFGKFQTMNSELVPPGEVRSNGFILRNQTNQDVHQNCIRTQKYKLVIIVTPNCALSGHAAQHLSESAQAIAGYYLCCIVMEPHCRCLLGAFVSHLQGSSPNLSSEASSCGPWYYSV